MLGHFCFFVMKQKKRRKNALHFQYISKLFFLSFGYFNPPTQMFGKLKFWKRTFKEQGFFFFFFARSQINDDQSTLVFLFQMLFMKIGLQ